MQNKTFAEIEKQHEERKKIVIEMIRKTKKEIKLLN